MTQEEITSFNWKNEEIALLDREPASATPLRVKKHDSSEEYSQNGRNGDIID